MIPTTSPWPSPLGRRFCIPVFLILAFFSTLPAVVTATVTKHTRYEHVIVKDWSLFWDLLFYVSTALVFFFVALGFFPKTRQITMKFLELFPVWILLFVSLFETLKSLAWWAKGTTREEFHAMERKHKQHIEDLNKQHTKLRKEAFDKIDSEIQAMTTQNEEFQRSFSDEKHDHCKTIKKVNDMTVEIKKTAETQRQIGGAIRLLTAHNDENLVLIRELDVLRAKQWDKTKPMVPKEITGMKDHHEQQVQFWHAENATRQQLLDALEKARKADKVTTQKLDKENATRKEAIEALKSAKASDKSNVDELEKELEDLKKKIAALKAELDHNKTKCATDKDALRKKTADLEAELENVKKNCAETKKGLTEKIAALEGSAKKFKDEKAALQKARDEAVAAKNAAEKSRDVAIKQAVAAAIKEKTAEIDGLAEQIKGLVDREKTSKAQVESCTKAVMDKMATINELTRKLHEVEDDRDEKIALLQDHLDKDASDDGKDKDGTINGLREDIVTLKADNDKLRAKADEKASSEDSESSDKIKKLRELNQKPSDRQEVLSKDNKSLKNALVQSIDDKTKLTYENDDLKKLQSAPSGDNPALKKTNADLLKQVEDLKKQQEKVKEVARKVSESLKKDLAEANAKNAELKQANVSQDDILNKTDDKKALELKTQLDAATKLANDAQAENSSIKSKMEESKAKVLEQENIILEFKDRVAVAEKVGKTFTEEMKKKDAEMQAKQEEEAKEKKEQDKILQELEEDNAELTAMNEKLEEQYAKQIEQVIQANQKQDAQFAELVNERKLKKEAEEEAKACEEDMMLGAEKEAAKWEHQAENAAREIAEAQEKIREEKARYDLMFEDATRTVEKLNADLQAQDQATNHYMDIADKKDQEIEELKKLLQQPQQQQPQQQQPQPQQPQQQQPQQEQQPQPQQPQQQQPQQEQQPSQAQTPIPKVNDNPFLNPPPTLQRNSPIAFSIQAQNHVQSPAPSPLSTQLPAQNQKDQQNQQEQQNEQNQQNHPSGTDITFIMPDLPPITNPINWDLSPFRRELEDEIPSSPPEMAPPNPFNQQPQCPPTPPSDEVDMKNAHSPQKDPDAMSEGSGGPVTRSPEKMQDVQEDDRFFYGPSFPSSPPVLTSFTPVTPNFAGHIDTEIGDLPKTPSKPQGLAPILGLSIDPFSPQNLQHIPMPPPSDDLPDLGPILESNQNHAAADETMRDEQQQQQQQPEPEPAQKEKLFLSDIIEGSEPPSDKSLPSIPDIISDGLSGSPPEGSFSPLQPELPEFDIDDTIYDLATKAGNERAKSPTPTAPSQIDPALKNSSTTKSSKPRDKSHRAKSEKPLPRRAPLKPRINRRGSVITLDEFMEAEIPLPAPIVAPQPITPTPNAPEADRFRPDLNASFADYRPTVPKAAASRRGSAPVKTQNTAVNDPVDFASPPAPRKFSFADLAKPRHPVMRPPPLPNFNAPAASPIKFVGNVPNRSLATPPPGFKPPTQQANTSVFGGAAAAAPVTSMSTGPGFQFNFGNAPIPAFQDMLKKDTAPAPAAPATAPTSPRKDPYAETEEERIKSEKRADAILANFKELEDKVD